VWVGGAHLGGVNTVEASASGNFDSTFRNTFRLASRADWDKMAHHLRPVYTAVNEADASRCLDEFHTIWGNRYPAIKTLWRNAWNEFVPFSDYSPEIRRVIYSTNAIWVAERPVPAGNQSPRPLPQRASRHEMPLPRRQIARPERHRTGTLDEPLEPALNAFAITFEGRLF